MKAGACLVLALLVLPTAAAAYDVERIFTSGDSVNRIDIAVLGDGYVQGSQAKLKADARSLFEALWKKAPFGDYKSFFNVSVVHVVSNQAGADGGAYGGSRDTALGATFGCFGVPQLLCIENEDKMLAIAAKDVPEADYIVVLVDEPNYGGSGGSYIVVTAHEDAPEVIAHEFGHTLAGLADEYEDLYEAYGVCGAECAEPNAAVQIGRNALKWSRWVDTATPLPTPETDAYANAIGAFEGCRYRPTGQYRPALRCKMRALDVPFCDVCEESLVLGFYGLVSPLDQLKPAADVRLGLTETRTLKAAGPLPASGTMSFAWQLDGDAMAETRSYFEVRGSVLGLGAHTVKVTLQDATPLVLRDPDQRLFAHGTFSLVVDTDTHTEDPETPNDTGSAPDDDTSNPPSDSEPVDTGAVCEPGARRCEGVFGWLVCDAAGEAFAQGGYCREDERCLDGACVPDENPTSTSEAEGSGCGCRAQANRLPRFALGAVIQLLL